MSKADDVFWRQFGVLLILLTLFGFAMYFVANAIGGQAYAKMRSAPDAVAERIAPFGQSRVGDPAGQTQAPAQTALAAPAASDAATPRSGSEVYNSACMACHATGVAEAPLLGDAAAWTERAAQGFDALVGSVIAGKGAMPPKAGNPALTEDDVRSALSYMLQEAGVEADGMIDAASTGAAGSTDPAAKDEARAAESVGSVDSSGQGQAAVTSAAAGHDVDLVAGGKIYQSACIACHLTGVEDAPKLDDRAAWEPRLDDLGMDGLVQSVTAGKGAMPPKGGFTNLTEDDLRNAVGFMLGEAGLSAGG